MKIFYIAVLLSTFLFASEISEAFGDLDGDSKDERVVVWQDGDLHRVLQIFKRDSENKWIKWQEFSNVIMNSDDGGATGDPFEGLEIKSRVIAINHSGGGGRFEWSYTHKYRLELKENLILYHGSYCEVSRPDLRKCAKMKDFGQGFSRRTILPKIYGK